MYIILTIYYWHNASYLYFMDTLIKIKTGISIFGRSNTKKDSLKNVNIL